MELQEVGKYSVEPFALERILELEVVKKVNEHARFHVRGVLKEGEQTGMIDQSWEKQPVKLIQDGKTLFGGVVTDLGVICESGVYYLEADAVSWTIELDREEMKRSFQERGRSYQSIANQLAAEAGGTVEYTALDKMEDTH